MREERVNFEDWINTVESLMTVTGILSHESKISPDGYRPYYEDGLPPYEALREEFGKDWVKVYQKYYFKTQNKDSDQ